MLPSVRPWWVDLGQELKWWRERRTMQKKDLLIAVNYLRYLERKNAKGMSKGTLDEIEDGYKKKRGHGEPVLVNPTVVKMTEIATVLQVRIEAHAIDETAGSGRPSSFVPDGDSPAMSMHPDHLVNIATGIAALVVERGTDEQRQRLGRLLSLLLAELNTADGGAAPSQATSFRGPNGGERRRGTARDSGHRRRSSDKKQAS